MQTKYRKCLFCVFKTLGDEEVFLYEKYEAKLTGKMCVRNSKKEGWLTWDVCRAAVHLVVSPPSSAELQFLQAGWWLFCKSKCSVRIAVVFCCLVFFFLLNWSGLITSEDLQGVQPASRSAVRAVQSYIGRPASSLWIFYISPSRKWDQTSRITC